MAPSLRGTPWEVSVYHPSTFRGKLLSYTSQSPTALCTKLHLHLHQRHHAWMRPSIVFPIVSYRGIWTDCGFCVADGVIAFYAWICRVQNADMGVFLYVMASLSSRNALRTPISGQRPLVTSVPPDYRREMSNRMSRTTNMGPSFAKMVFIVQAVRGEE